MIGRLKAFQLQLSHMIFVGLGFCIEKLNIGNRALKI